VSIEAGVLYVVATPIGHLDDLSGRAREVLAAVELIVAEDTRRSRILLRHYALRTPLLSLHEHNEAARVPILVDRLRRGAAIALVSDAGTPLICDPGHRLVSAAHAAGIRVIPVPGPSAVIAALSVAGLPVDRFAFEGYLPARAPARRARLKQLKHEPRTLVVFEAPHRILEAIADACDILGAERPAALLRELTKVHETVRSATLIELYEYLRADPQHCLGEFVLVFAPGPASTDDADLRRMLEALLKQLPLRQAVAAAAAATGRPRNEVYALALSLKRDR
jgi:16S rRNA (cytidine1402-2'-O)-methyltransferase